MSVMIHEQRIEMVHLSGMTAPPSPLKPEGTFTITLSRGRGRQGAQCHVTRNHERTENESENCTYCFIEHNAHATVLDLQAIADRSVSRQESARPALAWQDGTKSTTLFPSQYQVEMHDPFIVSKSHIENA